MTKKEFVSTVPALPVVIGGVSVGSKTKQFSSEKKSVGWNFCGKVDYTLPNGEVVRVQISGNATICGSGEWAEEEKAAA